MPVVGYVTRTFASRVFSSPQAQGGSGGVGYTLRAVDGRTLGSYQDVAAAQAAFRQFYGPSRILKWERQDLQGDIEQHVAIGTPRDPSEIWGEDLIQWIEPDWVTGSVILSNVTLGTILTVNDISGSEASLSTIAPAATPILTAADDNFKGRSTISLDRSYPQGLVSAMNSLSPPFTITVSANNESPFVGSDLFISDPGGLNPLEIGSLVDGSGRWRVAVGASLVAGPIGGDAPVVLVVEADGTDVNVRINGEDVGTFAAAPSGAASPEIGGVNTDAWSGSFGALMISSSVDDSGQRVRETERWFQRRYGGV